MAYKCDHSSCKRMKNDLEGEALLPPCPARAAAGTVNSRESDVPTSSGGQSQIRNSKCQFTDRIPQGRNEASLRLRLQGPQFK